MTTSQREILVRLAFAVFAVAALTLGGFAFAGNDTYQYDSLGRLVSVTYADGSSISYTYDSAGNRTAITQTAAP